MTQLKSPTALAIALLMALASSFPGQALPVLSQANNPLIFNAETPPSTGRPGRRSDAGSRGCGTDEAANTPDAKPLLALVPVQKMASSTVVFGKTAADYPTFWFDLPHQSALTATFVLQDQAGKSLYQANVALPKTAGIVSVTLPTTVAPLTAGQPYHWFFKLYCRSTSPPNSFVDGWIQREPLTPDLTQKLKTATLPQQVRLYAAHGFWFDALTTAAALRRKNVSDPAWAELLQAIGLEILATETIVTP